MNPIYAMFVASAGTRAINERLKPELNPDWVTVDKAEATLVTFDKKGRAIAQIIDLTKPWPPLPQIEPTKRKRKH